jgi:hypothetical protein
MAAKVLSVRVEITTLAGVYQILSNAGVPVQNMAMGKALRTLINTVVQGSVESEAIEELTEMEAAEYLESLSMRDAGFTVDSLKATAAGLAGHAHNVRTSYAPIEEDPLEEERREVMREVMSPGIEAAKIKVEEDRFAEMGMGDTAKLRAPEPASKPPDPLDNPNPPWRGAKKVPSAELITAKKVSKALTKFFNQRDQIGLMAARVTLAGLPSDMQGTDTAERLFTNLRNRFHAWAAAHPESPCPPSIKFE